MTARGARRDPAAWRRGVAALSLLLLAVLLVLLGVAAPRAGAQPAAATASGSGFVESATIDPGQRQLRVSGWVAAERPSVFVTNLIVRIGGFEVYRGRMHRFERPDAVRITGRADWLWSGFRATFALPRDTPAGRQPLAVSVRLGDGSEFTLTPLAEAATVLVPPPPAIGRWTALLAAIALAAPLAVLLGARPLARRLAARGGSPRAVPWLFAGTTLLSFVLLVGSGLTGSSLALAFDGPALVQAEGTVHWLGELRPVRSDEWEAITPLALAQLRHEPPLPELNKNLGSDGANMLVIGMTGVPVANLSALARPATWGFFVFDLRRALAWYWWLPFFGCFAAVWALLLRLFTTDWRIAAGLAASVAFAPYSVVFSGWPAYAALFPVLALLLVEAALRTRRVALGALCGAGAGWALAGFVLVLYPAWQISLAWLLAPLALAWFWRERRALRLGPPQAIALLLALAVLGLLLGAWWHGAHDAVQTIRGTVYPGQRSGEVGGDIDRWFLLKGLLSPLTMYLDSAATSASDAGSFVFLPIAAGAAVLLAWARARRIDALAAVPLVFTLLVLWFMFEGLDVRLAHATLLSSTTSYRMDLALGLAQTLLLAWLLAPAPAAAAASVPAAAGAVAAVPPPPPRWLRALAAALALLAALHAAWQLRLLPAEIGAVLPEPLLLLLCLAVAAASYWLLLRRRRAFALLYCGWMLGTALPFNPLNRAPTAIVLDAGLRSALEAAPGRVAVLEQRDWSMTLPAVGVPVLNSVFYHPQPGLWHTLDAAGTQRVLYNRYQRLLFKLAPLDASGPAWRIDSPRLDEVVVTLDAARFDFRLLGAACVIAPASRGALLAANPTLAPLATTDRYTLLRVAGR